MTNIHCPYDSFFKSLIQDKNIATNLFKKFLPPFIKSKVDFYSFELMNKSFVQQHLTQLHADIIYACFINQKKAYLTIEHQSRPDLRIPLRCLEYANEIMHMHLDQKNQNYPIVFSLCLYHGKQSPHPYGSEFSDYFHDQSMARKTSSRFFKLIDLTKITDRTLESMGIASFFHMILKHVFDKDLYTWTLNYFKSGKVLKWLNLGGTDRNLEVSLRFLLDRIDTDDPVKIKNLIQTIEKSLNSKGEKAMSIAQYFVNIGVQQGMQHGMQTTMHTVARSMLEKNYPIEDILELTDLSFEDILTLQKELRPLIKN